MLAVCHVASAFFVPFVSHAVGVSENLVNLLLVSACPEHQFVAEDQIRLGVACIMKIAAIVQGQECLVGTACFFDDFLIAQRIRLVQQCDLLRGLFCLRVFCKEFMQFLCTFGYRLECAVDIACYSEVASAIIDFQFRCLLLVGGGICSEDSIGFHFISVAWKLETCVGSNKNMNAISAGTYFRIAVKQVDKILCSIGYTVGCGISAGINVNADVALPVSKDKPQSVIVILRADFQCLSKLLHVAESLTLALRMVFASYGIFFLCITHWSSAFSSLGKLEKLEKLLHIGNIVIYVPFFLLIVSQCRHISVRI